MRSANHVDAPLREQPPTLSRSWHRIRVAIDQAPNILGLLTLHFTKAQTMRWLSYFLALAFVGFAQALSSSGNRLLVVIDELGDKDKYSKFWGDLECESPSWKGIDTYILGIANQFQREATRSLSIHRNLHHFRSSSMV